MTHDITDCTDNNDITADNEIIPVTEETSPPLCLVQYFAERAAYPTERNPKPPGSRRIGRVAERRGNLIILEFAAPPPTARRWLGGRSGKSLLACVCDALLLLLLLVSLLGCVAALLGCVAAFRF